MKRAIFITLMFFTMLLGATCPTEAGRIVVAALGLIGTALGLLTILEIKLHELDNAEGTGHEGPTSAGADGGAPRSGEGRRSAEN